MQITVNRSTEKIKNKMDIDKVTNSLLGVPGAYIHIPFCHTICPFCPYNKTTYRTGPVQRYFSALETEAAGYVDRLNAPFSSLYIGGGTPTLCLDELAPLVTTIAVAGERAIEVLPTHATPDRIQQILDMGINYISLGVQSFDAQMLRYLKRPTSVDDNLAAVKNVIGKFECVDVDLIFDVSFADETIFLTDLETCLKMGVDQVSTYPLMRFGYTPFGKVNHDRRKEHDVLRMAEALAAQFGYERRSVWTFNRKDAPNYSSITRPFFIGMGAGSASYTGRLFLINHFSIDRYIDKIQAGELPIARRFPLPLLASSAYALFWQAYTGRIDGKELTNAFGPLIGGVWRGLLNLTVACKWLSKNDDDFHLTPTGQNHYHDLERWVTYHFIEPLWSRMMQEHTQ